MRFSGLDASASPVGEFTGYFHENAQIWGHSDPAMPGKRAEEVAALEKAGSSDRIPQPYLFAAEPVVEGQQAGGDQLSF